MAELLEWFLALDSGFAFLVILPFVVAAIALVAEILRRPAARHERRAAPGLQRMHGLHGSKT